MAYPGPDLPAIGDQLIESADRGAQRRFDPGWVEPHRRRGRGRRGRPSLERAGVPRSTAMAMVGHRTEAIYRRYAIVDEVMLKEGAEKLAAYAEGKVLGKVKGATGIAPS